MDRLVDQLLWLTAKRSSFGGRRCRDYSLYGATGDTLLTARAFPWSREIAVGAGQEPDGTAMVLRRRRTFPFSGKVDVCDAAGRRIGVVSRGGRFFDAAGREVGRFGGARSAKSYALETAAATVIDTMLGSDSMVSGPSSFVLTIRGAGAGTLATARLPFETRPVPEPAGTVGLLHRLVPTRARRLMPQRGVPRGWKLERTTSVLPCDPRLYIAAALFAVELSYW